VEASVIERSARVETAALGDADREFGGADWPLERLEREIGELAAHIHAAKCRWLSLVAEFDRREAWADQGCKSCAHWLSWRCALAPSAAREHVRVARRLSELPQIRAAFGSGELSYSQVRALSRVATPELEESLLEVARYATAAQLERTLRAYQGVLERELPADELTHGDRYLVCEYDEDGSLLMRARLPADEGALVVAALDAARDSLRAAAAEDEPAGSDYSEDEPSTEGRDASAEAETRSASAEAPLSEQPPASNASALVLMAETLLECGPAERSGADSYQVVVHVDVDALVDQPPHGATAGGAPAVASRAGPLGDPSPDPPPAGACQLDDGAFLHPETARRLACDSSVVRILERDGRPLSVGRRTRSIPPALRRALQSRDHCCRFPGCTQRRFLHAHHIDHWAHGGPTEISNLVQLCRFHHRLVHEGGYRLERALNGEELCFRRPDGRPIPHVPEAHRVRQNQLARRNRGSGLEIGPESCASRWAGERLDLALNIDALVSRDSRLSDHNWPQRR
jgi:Domain of unknown function (DUF222)/HNH endonuclease